jgi:chromatin remodeling complex protein RSC6
MSDNLCEFLDLPKGSCMNWHDILRNINKYIMTNGLLNKESRSVSIDEKLLTILHPSFGTFKEIKLFKIIFYVKHNFSSLEVNINQLKTIAVV